MILLRKIIAFVLVLTTAFWPLPAGASYFPFTGQPVGIGTTTPQGAGLAITNANVGIERKLR